MPPVVFFMKIYSVKAVRGINTFGKSKATKVLHCSMGDGGRKLPSSREAALTMGQVPCEFQADQPRFTFSGEAELRGLPA